MVACRGRHDGPALLAAAYRHKRRDGTRRLAAGGFVSALLALDLFTAVQLTRAEGAHMPDGSRSAGVGVGAADRQGTLMRAACWSGR